VISYLGKELRSPTALGG